MPYGKSDNAVIRPDLGVVVDEHRQSIGMGMIAGKILPYFPVALQAFGFPVLPKEMMLKLKETARAPRAAYGRGDWQWENGIYMTKENGWEEPVDDREKAMYATLFDAEAVAAKRANKIVLHAREKRVSDLVFNTTRFSGHAVSNEWSDAVNATPITDVKDARQAVELQCGMTPNALITDSTTFDCIKECDQIVERIKYTFPGIEITDMNAAQVAQALGVKYLLVGGGVYDAAGENKDANITRFWPSDQVMLTRIAEDNDITEPCIGRTFYWTEESGSEGEVKAIVETYREDKTRGDVVRVRHDSDEALLASHDDSKAIKSDIAAAVSYRMTNIQ
ncbi:MAG: hypothetical protein SWH61_03325 [Thermodesulfobacteriota bacterium]|nr:hypothetical protein [Thermodesulfobacteriota bacterium]